MKKNLLQELQKLVAQCEISILYKPLKDEINYNDQSFPLKIHLNNLILPDNKDSDPFEWADKCITKFKNTKPYILIPGTQFDKYGTRHGKGGGWYDRFLSKVPRTWLRVGITNISGISHSPISHQEWDESIDWIMVSNNNLWEAYKINAIKSEIQ